LPPSPPCRRRAAARHIVWIITSMFALCIGALGAIPIDRVVTSQAKVGFDRADDRRASRWKPHRPFDRGA